MASPNLQTMAEKIAFISKERAQVIGALAVAGKKTKGVPDANNPINNALYARLEQIFDLLETNVEMSPSFKAQTKIDTILPMMYNNPDIHFPQSYVERAKTLMQTWENERWGKQPTPPPGSDDESPNAASSGSVESRSPHKKGGVRRAFAAPGGVVHVPPADHSIWGLDGIMHGIAVKIIDGKKTKVDDTRFTKRDNKVYGHNGLEIGAWFPTRLVAIFRGAHNASQAGINSNGDSCAYSIVVSSYDHLDQDLGETLYYSGSGSMDNTDPRRPAPSSVGTQALHRSLAMEKPVRVLRASGTSHRLAPPVGLRYDGLYKVVAVRTPLNAKGGQYEQFELRRMEGQGPLEVVRARPTMREQRDFEHIDDWVKYSK